MNETQLENLDLTLYSKKLNNGLEVYIVPKNNLNNIYVTFSTRYGSVQSEFVPNDSYEMMKVPDGVAHFLEHKMFEQEKGVDPFTFFSERGADANANTSAFKTTYLFSGPDFFEENLNYLLDYVQTPYFTDENVEKEKGIIEQEIKMYEDDPYSRLYEGTLFNSFKEHPIRKSVIGTVESINSITKEILYKCYNTFYNPGNMIVVVTGNVDAYKTLEIIEKNQENKKFDEFYNIKLKQYKEPDEVFKQKETLKMNVTIPKVTISYKFNLNDLPNMTLKEKLLYLLIIFDSNFGSTSLFNEQLKQEKMINSNLEISSIDNDSHILYTIFFESEDYDKIQGLNTGADDYITKPFHPLELIARVNSNIRRYTKLGGLQETQLQDIYQTGELELNNETKQVMVDGKEIKLKRKKEKLKMKKS